MQVQGQVGRVQIDGGSLTPEISLQIHHSVLHLQSGEMAAIRSGAVRSHPHGSSLKDGANAANQRLALVVQIVATWQWAASSTRGTEAWPGGKS